MISGLREKIFSIGDTEGFEALAMEIFRYQAANNQVYSEYLSNLKIIPDSVKGLTGIPFLPIEFFRNHRVIAGKAEPEVVFESSGTTGSATSRHFVTDASVYEESFLRTFRLFYGAPEDFFIAALLPSYIERGNSSLLFMADRLIRLSAVNGSSFFLEDYELLLKNISKVKRNGGRIMLLGVTFALLDLAEKYSPDLSSVIVVETGGMKGRRKEMTREELHSVLTEKLNIESVHSEYGMTELLSQAWSLGKGIFNCPPWMKVLLREVNDPLSVFESTGVTGGMNIIDLANFNSCSFIATGDLGKLHEGSSFEVLGRFDNSDLRGCNLLVQ